MELIRIRVVGFHPAWRHAGSFSIAGQAVGDSEIEFRFRFRNTNPQRSLFRLLPNLLLHNSPDANIVRSDLSARWDNTGIPTVSLDIAGLDLVADADAIVCRIKESLSECIDLLSVAAE